MEQWSRGLLQDGEAGLDHVYGTLETHRIAQDDP